MFTAESKKKKEYIQLEEILETGDVLLVVSPNSEPAQPILGIHSLQASCRGAGIKTTVLYSNLPYENLIGRDILKTISTDYQLIVGERIFAAAAFGLPSVSIGKSIHKFFDPGWAPDHLWQIKRNIKDPQVPQSFVSFRKWLGSVDLEYLESLTTNWLHALAQQIVNIGFRIVGCSTTFGGLVPAVALLNCIKKANPDVITIIGGASCEGEMAEGILSLNAGIDYIFSGEGEITFPALVKKILNGRCPGEKVIYGEHVIDLDTISLPDYQDFFKQKEKFYPHWSSSSGKSNIVFPFETSRGCWYGKCKFCALNGENNVFRSKSPDVIIQNLKALMKRHSMNVIFMTDNMMPLQYFNTLLPRLSTEIPSIKFYYQITANLTLDQVLSLKQAGIMSILPGIESLSPSLLRHMHKPYTVRENIALLRYTRSVGIDVQWNFLVGFPGDQTSEYEEMLHLFTLVRHLQPPMGMLPLILFRFSQYYRSPKTFGISNSQPAEIYRDTLPLHVDLDKIAFYFTAEFPSQSRENPTVIAALWEEYQNWCKAWAAYEKIPLDLLLPTLHVTRKTSHSYVLEDTRGLPGKPKRMEIDREQASLLLVARPLEKAPGIDWAVDAGLGVVMESWFIPLATAEPALLQEFEREYDNEQP